MPSTVILTARAFCAPEDPCIPPAARLVPAKCTGPPGRRKRGPQDDKATPLSLRTSLDPHRGNASAVKMRTMPGRALRITSRIVFWICGLTSLLIAYLYVSQQGEDLPVESEWVIFAVALGFVGVVSVAAGTIPRSWIAKMCKSHRDDRCLFSGPVRLLAVFAAIAYLVACFAYLAPHTWNLNLQVMLALCPMYLVKMIIDPSPAWIFLVLAPMNAAVFGALGLTLGYVSLALRKQP